MTNEQWDKVIRCASILCGDVGPMSAEFSEALKGLISITDEEALDVDLAAHDAATKTQEVADLEARLAELNNG